MCSITMSHEISQSAIFFSLSPGKYPVDISVTFPLPFYQVGVRQLTQPAFAQCWLSCSHICVHSCLAASTGKCVGQPFLTSKSFWLSNALFLPSILPPCPWQHFGEQMLQKNIKDKKKYFCYISILFSKVRKQSSCKLYRLQKEWLKTNNFKVSTACNDNLYGHKREAEILEIALSMMIRKLYKYSREKRGFISTFLKPMPFVNSTTFVP